MTRNQMLAAVDLGASGGRCALGHFDGNKLSLEMIHRFANAPVEVLGHWYWDVLSLYQSIQAGLARAARVEGQELLSIGIDSWGVDFALLDRAGKLAGNPYCARDPQTRRIQKHLFQCMPKAEIFRHAGIQFMEINSLCQLLAMRLNGDPVYEEAATFLHIADLMNYWLTGVKCCEYTNASTSQILDVHTKAWSEPIIEATGLNRAIFPAVVMPGERVGRLRSSIMEEVGRKDVHVIATAAHDTAAAILAIPVQDPCFGYISSGTWALLGRELAEPLMSDDVSACNVGNEGGAFNTITFLKNIANMWFVQELRRGWAMQGNEYSWDELSRLAGQALPFQAFIDPDDPEFLTPGYMPAKIQSYCRQTGQRVPQSKPDLLRVVYESLALKYRYVNDRITTLTGQPIATMHIIGGGSQNQLLDQFAANALGIPIIAGPAEATTLGNLIVQLIALGLVGSLQQARQVISYSFPTQTYWPQEQERWAEAYDAYLSILERNHADYS